MAVVWVTICVAGDTDISAHRREDGRFVVDGCQPWNAVDDGWRGVVREPGGGRVGT